MRFVISNYFIALWTILSGIVFVFYGYIQPITIINGGVGWDGTQYTTMFNYFKSGTFTFDLIFPFNQRPFYPYIAYLISNVFNLDMLMSFRILNLSFNVLNVYLILYIFVKIFNFNKINISFVIFWFIFHYLGSFRLLNNYPYSVDSLSLSISLLLFISLIFKNYKTFFIIAIFGVGVKEQVLPVVLILLISIFLKSKIDMKGLNKKQFTFLFITIIFCFLINYYIKYYGFSNIEPGSSIKTILVWGYTHLTNPLDFVRYLVAIFLTFGSFILIYFINFSYKDFIINIKEDSYMYSFSLAFLFFIFAFLAASDMERVLWQAFPFFCIFFLSSMEKLNKFYIAFGFLLSIPIMRLVSLIPEASQALPLILKSDLYMINDKTPGDTVGFYSWLAEWMEIGQVASWGIYMIFIYLILNKIYNLTKNETSAL